MKSFAQRPLLWCHSTAVTVLTTALLGVTELASPAIAEISPTQLAKPTPPDQSLVIEGLAGQTILAQVPAESLDEADELLQSALAALQSDDYQQAYDQAVQAYKFYQTGGDTPRLAASGFILGAADITLGNVERGYEFIVNTVLPLAESAGDQRILTAAQTLIQALEQSDDAEAERSPRRVTATQLLEDGARAFRKSEYDQAQQYWEQARSIYTELGDRIGIANSLMNLGTIDRNRGNYQRTRQRYQEALALFEALDDRDGQAKSTLNLGNNAWSFGDYPQAISFYERALPMFEAVEDRQGQGLALMNLGESYRALEEFQTAVDFYEDAYAIFEAINDRQNQALVVMNLASAMVEVGRREEAITLYEGILPVFQELEDRDGMGRTLVNLGRAYRVQGQHEQAVALYQEALPIFQALGDRSAQSIARTNLGASYWSLNQPLLALETLQQGADVQEQLLNLSFKALTEAEQKAFLEELSNLQNLLVALNIQALSTDTTATRAALTLVLQRKGRILDALSENQRLLRQSLTPAEQQLFDDLNRYRTEYANLASQSSGNGPNSEPAADSSPALSAAQQQDQRQALLRNIQEIEQTLVDRSAAFRLNAEPVSLEAIQALIPADSALIEFFQYAPVNLAEQRTEEQTHYVAYVLRSQGEPQVFDLGSTARIDQLVTIYSDSIRDDQPGLRRQAARQMYQRLIEPLQPALGDTQHLLISPDGNTNSIPFGALLDAEQRYLVETHELVYLSSGRDLLRLQTSQPSQQQPLIVANPSYAQQPQNTSSFTVAQASTQTTRGAGDRNLRAAGYNLFDWSPLPATAPEAQAIGQFLGVDPYTETQATETLIKQTPGPEILHLATHGFFQAQAAAQDTFENPLLHSGLVFAGANNPTQNAGDDGILTALEISGLDLRGTQLVVMSACETGLGEIESGEGVYGLRRAFTLAGAESQVMSLWQVDDNATKELMIYFYENLQAGQGRAEALRQAQLTLAQNPTYADPIYWAAFIPVGNWRPLQ
ncbi:MAG: CHAT domain-containing tetratricopeptide repeat protein [Cyanobacteria bacterium P01_H01_bin.121]